MSTQKAFYLAGPMTGIPQFNFPLFERVAKELRDAGWKIISPAELDSDAIREYALKSADGKYDAGGLVGGETWGEILARDVRVVADECEGIVLLPGWEDSRGARLEAFVGVLCQHRFFMYDDDGTEPYETSADYVQSLIV